MQVAYLALAGSVPIIACSRKLRLGVSSPFREVPLLVMGLIIVHINATVGGALSRRGMGACVWHSMPKNSDSMSDMMLDVMERL